MVVTTHVSMCRFDELVKQQGKCSPVAGYIKRSAIASNMPTRNSFAWIAMAA